MKRIMIFGRPGSGKAVFSYEISQKTGIPVYHLDRFFYINNWKERDKNDFMHIQKEMVNQKRWIIDGNCTQSLEVRFEKSDLIVYFDFGRLKCLYRILKRHLYKENYIHDRAPDCLEKITFKFLKYMWFFEKRVREKIKIAQKQYPEKKIIKVSNNRDLEKIKRIILEKNITLLK